MLAFVFLKKGIILLFVKSAFVDIPIYTHAKVLNFYLFVFVMVDF